jgi:uncharacterized protein YdeI (YjbR/CyaY-like superfamily)
MEILEFADAAAWEAWLSERHATAAEAWLRVARRHARLPLLRIVEAGEVGLCFGWVDSHRKGLDDQSFLQRYSRRQARSPWSRVNVATVEALIAGGRMRPPGLAEVEAARADGRWAAAYASQASAEVPADLSAALDSDDRARAAFARLSRSQRYAMFLPLLKAQTPQARERSVKRAVRAIADRG